MTSIKRPPRRRAALPINPSGGLLGQSAEYALRALSVLAANPDAGPLRAVDLAERTGVPGQYLAKILRRLVEHGLLAAQRGHGGGFELSRAPAEIRVADVLDALGAAPVPDRCAFGWGRCSPRSPCPLHPMWSRLADAFQRWASTSTLADVSTDGWDGGASRPG